MKMYLSNSDQQRAPAQKRRDIHYHTIKHHTLSGHYQPASETPFEWRFAGGPIVARFYMLIGWSLSHRVKAVDEPVLNLNIYM